MSRSKMSMSISRLPPSGEGNLNGIAHRIGDTTLPNLKFILLVSRTSDMFTALQYASACRLPETLIWAPVSTHATSNSVKLYVFGFNGFVVAEHIRRVIRLNRPVAFGVSHLVVIPVDFNVGNGAGFRSWDVCERHRFSVVVSIRRCDVGIDVKYLTILRFLPTFRIASSGGLWFERSLLTTSRFRNDPSRSCSFWVDWPWCRTRRWM